MKSIKTVITTTVCATTIAFSAFAEEKPTASTVLVTVDGIEITVGHVVALREKLPDQYKQLPDQTLMEGIVDQLIQQTVLMRAIENNMNQQATLGLENKKRAFMASEMMDRISNKAVSEEVLQAAYDEHYDAAIPDQEFAASHILVETEEEALNIIKQLNDGADFGEMAKEHSTGPSGPSGGNLGWFGKGQMVPPFENAVVEMATDEISAPVETQFGWHVIKLNGLRDIAGPTLEEVRSELAQEIQQRTIEGEITRLTALATVVRAELDIDPAIIRDVSVFYD